MLINSDQWGRTFLKILLILFVLIIVVYGLLYIL
jgi:hypothetical protein